MTTRSIALRGKRLPRRLTYPLVGAGLAYGAPLGLALLRLIQKRVSLDLTRLVLELRSDPILYGYVTVSTLAVLPVLGRHLGKLEDRLEGDATRDVLTGLANRRYFEERLGTELLRAERQGYPLALLAIDVDHLKPLNDFEGHSAGDAALAALGVAMQRSIRRTDLGARVGGDEFCIVAPDTRAAVAAELAERLRENFSQAMLALGHPEVTVSVGIADLTTSGFSVSELVAQADTALYVSKARGRNQVILYEPGLGRRLTAPPARPEVAREASRAQPR